MITSRELSEGTYCLHNVSKDLEGRLYTLDSQNERCEDGCETLVVEQDLVLAPKPHDCDSEHAGPLDGRLVARITQIHTGGDPQARAVHAGTFRWRASAGMIVGELAGVTNAGTHREPPFAACQRCHEPFVMEGHLEGRFVRTAGEAHAGCQVVADYRLRLDPEGRSDDYTVVGTLEGSLLCPCAGRPCFDAGGFPVGVQLPNPVTSGAITVEVFDHTGTPVASNVVLTYGQATPFTGLLLGYGAEIKLRQPTTQAELQVYAGAQLASFEGKDANGNVVATAQMTLSHQAETVVLAGQAPFEHITAIVPNSELLLRELCLR